MTPGATPLTLMPVVASRCPSDRINPFIACLAATYNGVARLDNCPAIDEIMTTRFGFVGLTLSPEAGARNSEMANWVERIGCVMLISKVVYPPPSTASLLFSLPGGCQKLLPVGIS
jgi:hypothetical protein